MNSLWITSLSLKWDGRFDWTSLTGQHSERPGQFSLILMYVCCRQRYCGQTSGAWPWVAVLSWPGLDQPAVLSCRSSTARELLYKESAIIASSSSAAAAWRSRCHICSIVPVVKRSAQFNFFASSSAVVISADVLWKPLNNEIRPPGSAV